MNDCNNSSHYYNSTPITGTSNSIEWQGGDIECLNICTGNRLTQVETNIANKVCELAILINAEVIILPACLVAAFGTKDKEVLEFIQFILDQYCVQQSQIDGINSTLVNFNPLITVDYACCSDNPCVTTGTVTLTQSLQNIISCLCTQKGRIDELETSVSTALLTINSYQTQLNLFQTQLNNSNAVIQGHTAQLAAQKIGINCLMTETGSSCTPI